LRRKLGGAGVQGDPVPGRELPGEIAVDAKYTLDLGPGPCGEDIVEFLEPLEVPMPQYQGSKTVAPEFDITCTHP
jgi:hypothetical protein